MASAEPEVVQCLGLPVVLAPRAGLKRPIKAKGTLLVPCEAAVRRGRPRERESPAAACVSFLL